MTPWQAAKERDPAMYNWLVSNGWTAAEYNALEKWEQAGLRTEMNGGLDETSFLSLWSEAAVDVTKGYGDTIGEAATATGRTIRNTAILAVVGILGVAAIVYNEPIRKVLKR